MIYRIAVVCTLISCILSTPSATAQSGGRYLDMKARVLDILFPLDVTPKPYFSKMILRFSDSDTQLIVVVYPGGKSELIRYSLSGMGNGKLSQLISKMVAENTNVTDREIAAKLKVDVIRSSINHEALSRSLDELRTVQISPILENRVAVDEFSEYDFWYDTWQESLHYTITSPLGNTPQDKLGKWMIKFRASVPILLKAGSAPK